MSRRVLFCISALACLGTLFISGSDALGAFGDGNLVDVNRFGGVDSTPFDYSNSGPTYGVGNGGEFRITGLDGSALGEMFKTFCIEYTENITLGGDYIATIDGGAILGGVDGQSQDYYDPLSGATQFLYRAYRTNTLDNFVGDFQYDDHAWADALQLVFWRLEGEGTRGSFANGTNAAKLWDFYLDNQAYLSTYSDASVQVMNLWINTIDDNGNPFADNLPATTAANYALLNEDSAAGRAFRFSLAGYKAQSQIYYSGNESFGPVLPEPASVVAWCGLACLGFFGARRRKASSSSAR